MSIAVPLRSESAAPAFRQLADSLNDVFWIYGPQRARFHYVSPAYEREWLRSASALYADSRDWLAPVHEDDRQRLQASFDRLAFGEGYSMEYRTTTCRGAQRWIAERAVPLAREDGHSLQFAGVSQDITAHKEVELQLLRSDRRKDEFLAMLSHELRNPLHAIRSATAVLETCVDGLAIEGRAICIIERQVDHLTRLVEDLLDVSRITHGKIRLHSEVVRLGEVIEAAVDANRALVDASRLHLRVKRPPAELWILGDVVRLTQVFSNLLHNAIKFSVAGGIIEISVRRGEGNQQVSVSVRDEGAGIAPNLIDSVFDLFTQDEQSLARNRGGLGIGLSVVRSLVKLHGGAVSVRSDGVGKGSEFVVALPLACAPIAVTSASAVEPRHGTNQRVLIANGTRDVVEAMRVPLEMGRHAPRLVCDG